MPIRGIFGGFFSPDGGIFHGEQAGTDTGKQSAQWAGIDVRNNGHKLASPDGGLFDGGNRQETGKGRQGRRNRRNREKAT